MTLLELIIVVGISTFIFAGLTAAFVLGRNAWTISGTMVDLQQQGRTAMERMVREISQVPYSATDICSWPGWYMTGKLQFSIPIAGVDRDGVPIPVAGSIYKPDGTLKLGARYSNGLEDLGGYIVYKLPAWNDPNYGLGDNSAYPNSLFRFVRGNWWQPNQLEKQILASNVKSVNFVRDPNTVPGLIIIILEMEKKTLLNQTVNLVLSSRVSLRNMETDQRPTMPTPTDPDDLVRYKSTGYVVYNNPDTSQVGW